MSRFTKQALIASFMNIAAKKPIEKITVRDITEDCGLNRNTFYYYFSDVYRLIEEMLTLETEKAIARSREEGSLAGGCIAIVEWIEQNKAAFRNIYNTMGRDSVEYAISKSLDSAIEGYVTRCAKEGGSTISDSDMRLIASVCHNVFFGFLSDWMRRNMRIDPREHIRRTEELFLPSLFEAIRFSGEKPLHNPDAYN